MRTQLESLWHEVQKWPLSLRPAARVANLKAGDFLSTYIGEGSELEDIREYIPGDNLRQIHIPTSARLGEVMVVQQREEREARAVCILDVSPSMLLRVKSHTAFVAASMLLASAIKNRMACGLVLYSGISKAALPVRMNLDHLQRAIDILCDVFDDSSQDSETLAPYVFPYSLTEYRARFLPPGSLVFVISDFLREENLRMLASEWMHHEVAAIIVQDDLEYTFPSGFSRSGSFVKLFDPETKAVHDQWVSKRSAQKLRADNEARFDRLTAFFNAEHRFFAHLRESDVPMAWHTLSTLLQSIAAQYLR